MAKATLSISSKNYSSWSLRGWLLCKFAGLDFTEELIPTNDPSVRAELLLLSPSFLVPCLKHGNVKTWGSLGIAEYLNAQFPDNNACFSMTGTDLVILFNAPCDEKQLHLALDRAHTTQALGFGQLQHGKTIRSNGR